MMRNPVYTVLMNKEQFKANRDEIDGLAFIKDDKDYAIITIWLGFFEAIKARFELIRYNRKAPKEYKIVLKKGIATKYY